MIGRYAVLLYDLVGVPVVRRVDRIQRCGPGSNRSQNVSLWSWACRVILGRAPQFTRPARQVSLIRQTRLFVVSIKSPVQSMTASSNRRIRIGSIHDAYSMITHSGKASCGMVCNNREIDNYYCLSKRGIVLRCSVYFRNGRIWECLLWICCRMKIE